MPWQVGSSKSDESGEHFKYQYHPGGDKKKGLKNAPGALNTVIIPNVTLTKVGSLQFDAGRDQSGLGAHHTEQYAPRLNMTNSISGAKMDTRLVHGVGISFSNAMSKCNSNPLIHFAEYR